MIVLIPISLHLLKTIFLMIEISLWRARVGSFNVKKLVKLPNMDSLLLFLNIYFSSILQLTYSVKYIRLHSNEMIALIAIAITNYYLSLHNLPTTSCKDLNTSVFIIFLLDRFWDCIAILVAPYIAYLLLCCGDIHINPGPCSNFSISHTNIRSLTTSERLSDVEDILINYYQHDIIALSETHLSPSVNNDILNLDNYTLFRKDRNRHGGGVAFYCKSTILCKRRSDLEADDIEILWIEARIGNRKFLLSSCYRPPGQTAAEIDRFLNHFQLSVELAIDEGPTAVLILGDFNDRSCSWYSNHSNSEIKNKLLDLSNTLNLKQYINEPTRGNNILDLLFTNKPDLLNHIGVLPPLPDLDHSTIFGKLNIVYNTSSTYSKVIWNYNLGNYSDLNIFLLARLTNFPFDDHNLNDLVLSLTNILLEGMNLFIPHKQISIKKRDKPWFNPFIRKLFKACYNLHKRKNKSNSEEDILAYQIKRREAKNAFRNARNKYYSNLANDISNSETTSKTFWKLLKSVFSSNTSGIPTLIDEGIEITDDKDKSELLNNFFVSQTYLPDNPNNLPEFRFLTDARLDRITVTIEMVKNILDNLNTSKAVGPDGISNKLLKECSNILCKPLSFIFQLSLDSGIFPDTWKEAIVSAIFKKLDPSLTKNYRPISLLSCISKVFEKLVFNHIYPHFNTNKLLTPNNSGFKPGDGAINRLLKMTHDIQQNLDRHKDSILISIDISKAFDRIWHQGLLFKLKQFGITGNLHNWFCSYLTGRSQRVKVGGQESSNKEIRAGVPQGSVLGPLLFLVYINDMCEGLHSDAHQFADDTTLVHSFSNPSNAVELINNDLCTLSNWADKWRVTFNPLKTSYLLMTFKKKPPKLNPIIFYDTTISSSNSVTTLGVTITCDLSWNEHIKNIINKATKRLVILNKYKRILPRVALETIYISMIRPILEYGDILFDCCSLSASESIESVQRKAALACTGAYRVTSYRSLLLELNWEPLSSRRKQHRLTIYYRLINNLLPEYLCSILPVRYPTTYNLRHQLSYLPPFARLTSTYNSFIISTTRDWNELSDNIKVAPSIASFKLLIRGPNKFNPYHRLCNGKPGILLTRIRLGLSGLNQHRFKYNLIPSSICSLCNLEEESEDHYFLTCPTYILARQTFFYNLTNELGIDTTQHETLMNIILEGNNIHPGIQTNLLSIIYQFITETNRFR